MRRSVKVALVGLLPLALAGAAEARITKIQINSRAVAYGGASFGSVGQYETLRGIVFGEVDPNDPLNEVITDIKLAPRNAHGMVEYNVDFWLSKPVDMSKANGTLLHDVPNRGNVRSLELNVGGAGDATAGDGFVLRQGFVLSDNGWEGDVATGLQVRIPVAKNRNGSEIVNRIRAEYILTAAASTVSITTPPSYEAVSTNNAGATLTRRVHQDDARETIPNSDWAFADEARGRDDDDDGLEGRNHASCPAAAMPDNPLGNSIKNAIIYGSSQSGRWIRTFIQLGFNQDENRNLVLEGAIPHKSSNRGAFNVRFGQPDRLSGCMAGSRRRACTRGSSRARWCRSPPSTIRICRQ